MPFVHCTAGLVLLPLLGLLTHASEPSAPPARIVALEGRTSFNGWTYCGGPMHVMGMKADRQETSVWLATTVGLVRLDVAAGKLRRWTTLDGLQDNFTYDVDFDGEGRVWAATYSGVSRFDGRSFHNASRKELGIPHHRFSSVAVDGGGRVWIGSAGDRRPQGALCLVPGGRWVLYNQWALDAEFPHAVTDIEPDGDGGVWIAGSEGKLPVDLGAGYYQPLTARLFHVDRYGAPEMAPLEKEFWISQIAMEQDTALLAVVQARPSRPPEAGGVLYRLSWPGWVQSGKDRAPDLAKATWQSLEKDAGVTSPVRSIYRDPRGQIWIATEKDIGRLVDGKFTSHIPLPPDKGKHLARLVVLGGGKAAVFCVNQGNQDPGVFVWRGSAWEHLTTALDGPVHPSRGLPIIGIHGRDLQGRLHFMRDMDTVLDGKLWSVGPRAVDFVYDKYGRTAGVITSPAAKGADNLLWLKGRDRPVSHREFFGVDYFPARFRDGRGHFWAYGFKHHSNDLLEFDGNRVIDHVPDNRFFLRVVNSVGYNPTVRAVVEDGQGRLWLATTTGLLRHGGGTRWEWVGGRFDGMLGMMGWHVHSNGRNLVSFAGSWGTSEYDMLRGRWLNFTDAFHTFPSAEPRLPGSYVEAVVPDLEGRMWYGTYEGGVACRGLDGTWQYYTTADGLACNACWGIWCDDDGTMWFTSEAGAQSLDRKAFRRGLRAGNEP